MNFRHLFICGLLFTVTSAQAVDEEALRAKGMDRAKAALDNSIQLSEETRSKVSDIGELVESEQFTTRMQIYREQILSEQGVDIGRPKKSPAIPVLFISSSIPLDTLRRYAADLERVRGVMVLRGAIGGLTHIRPTVEWIAKVIRRDENCSSESCSMRNVEVIIDPFLFDRYQIDSVPALVVDPRFEIAGHCNEKHVVSNVPVVYGDASLHEGLVALNELASFGALNDMIRKLEN